jgi:formate hydrogenlyase transcriptional activator
MVQEQKFRADLYYRLNVFPIELPPLRERRADIPFLINHFARKFEARYGRCMGSIRDDALQTLLDYDWPGNIRELQNVIERAVIKGFVSLEKSEATPSADSVLSDRTMIEAERAHITATLQKSNWVVGGRQGAAFKLGLPRTTLIWKMQKLGIWCVRPNGSH